jgi:hypothetical protein
MDLHQREDVRFDLGERTAPEESAVLEASKTDMPLEPPGSQRPANPQSIVGQGNTEDTRGRRFEQEPAQILDEVREALSEEMGSGRRGRENPRHHVIG